MFKSAGEYEVFHAPRRGEELIGSATRIADAKDICKRHADAARVRRPGRWSWEEVDGIRTYYDKATNVYRIKVKAAEES